jgi:L-lactate dehydrogenase complex protein LldE
MIPNIPKRQPVDDQVGARVRIQRRGTGTKESYNVCMTKVQLFTTCLVDSFFPKTGLAVANVLQRLGCSVEFPARQTCCGQPLFNAGLREQARPVAEHTIRTLEAVDGDIVIPSGSCAHMLRHGYPELYADDAHWLKRAQDLAERVFEFTEYVVDRLDTTDLGARWEGVITYHASCHTLRGLRVDRQPRALLGAVRGARLVELPEAEDCCGFGGIFSVEHPELSAEMLKRKISNLDTSTADTLVVAEPGCLMHIAGGIHRRKGRQKVMHVAEVLANT